jgi:hypothetical protein
MVHIVQIREGYGAPSRHCLMLHRARHLFIRQQTAVARLTQGNEGQRWLEMNKRLLFTASVFGLLATGATAHDCIANRREWLCQAALNGARLRSRRQGNEHQSDGE